MNNSSAHTPENLTLEMKARLGLQFLLADWDVEAAYEGMLEEYLCEVMDAPNPQRELADHFESVSRQDAMYWFMGDTDEDLWREVASVQTMMSFSDLAHNVFDMTEGSFDEIDFIRTVFGPDSI